MQNETQGASESRTAGHRGNPGAEWSSWAIDVKISGETGLRVNYGAHDTEKKP